MVSEAKKILPVILLTMYICLYHAYVIGYILIDPEIQLWQRIVYLLLFHLFYYMMIWTTLATIFQPLPVVPHDFKLNNLEIKLYNHSTSEKKFHLLNYVFDKRKLFSSTRTLNGNLRFCSKEYQFKPDRAHHCSQCGRCILKMDHHCQWLNTCICFTNQKGFILNLFYTFIVCLIYVCTAFNRFIFFWTEHQDDDVFAYYFAGIAGYVLAIILGSISGIFFMFHIGLIAQNKTLIEDMLPVNFVSRSETYDLGFLPNIAQVFGYSISLWFCPIFNHEGDGIYFPTRRITKREDEIELQRQKLDRNFSDFIR